MKLVRILFEILIWKYVMQTEFTRALWRELEDFPRFWSKIFIGIGNFVDLGIDVKTELAAIGSKLNLANLDGSFALGR
jgi:hypothetical protein